jgi:cell division protein FtsL
MSTPPPTQPASGGKTCTVLCIALMGLFLVLGLTQVWLNIERVDLAYKVGVLENRLMAQRELIDKLEVERNNLSSPQRLRTLAREFALGPAQSGQVRRIAQ